MNKMLHRGFGLAICLALALSLVLPAMVLAQACTFVGTASVDGAPVADGTTITAWAENLATHEMDEVDSTTTTSVPVPGFYDMVFELDPGTHSIEIHFKIGTLNATETATWVQYDLVVTNLTASTTPLPVVNTVNPDQGYQGDTLDVTITGTNFNGAESVSFGAGITVNNFTPDSTQITASISIASGATLGTRDVSVTTPEGTGTLEDGFTVLSPEPTVTAVDPDEDRQGETLDVVITGTNFNGATSVSFGAGITVNDFTVDSNTQITANISIASAATLGTRDVSVTTPEGTGTLEDGFTVLSEIVPEPTVTAVDPDQGYQGETLDVVITGTNFNWATSVSFGAGITVNDFTPDSTQITASISIASDATLGARTVSVTSSGGTGTLADSFTVVEPGEWIDVPLYEGMTIVPVYPGFDNDLPANLPAEAVLVWHQVTADEEATSGIPAGTWLYWIRGAPSQYNSLHTLVAGKAYLVSATAACVWSVPAT